MQFYYSIRVALAIWGLILTTQAISADVVTVSLSDRPQSISATSASTSVVVRDVASVRGSDVSATRRIAALDVETLGEADRCTVTRRQVESRLLLAGFKREQFRVVGPESVSVHTTSGQRQRENLELTLANEIARQFGLAPGEVTVRLLSDRGWQATLAKVSSGKMTPTVFLGTKLPFGRSQIDVEFEGKHGNRFSDKLDVQVAVMTQVTLARTRIVRGSQISREMVTTVTRPMLRQNDFATESAVVGSVARRDIARNEIILENSIDSNSRSNVPVIRRDELVDVVIRVGAGEVRLKNARAMGTGRVGETIAVMNTKTKTRLNVVVVGKHLAKVSSPGVRR